MRTSAPAVTFTGLAASTRYWVSVLAFRGGAAQRFAGVYCTTLAEVPAPVLSCTATSTSVSVSWEAVAGATRYRARLGGGAWTGDITATSHVFAGLSAASTHAITVQSGDAGGWGNAAVVRCVTAAHGVSCAQTTSTSVILEWEDRDDAQYWYAAISAGTGYVGDRTHNRRVDGTSTEFTELERGTRYVMLLWWYDYENKWHPTTPPPECWTKHLDTPAIAGRATGGTTLTIEWAAVPGAQRYQVQISPAGVSGQSSASRAGAWETVVSTGLVHTFAGLVPGAEYEVLLRAVDDRGNPSAGARASRQTSKARCQAVTSTSVTLAWDDPDGEYEWQLRRTLGANRYADAKTIARGAATTAVFTGLQPDTGYWFDVRQRMASADAWEAHPPQPRCHTLPPSPTIVQCPQAADVDGTIRWTHPKAHSYRITLDSTQTPIQWIHTNSTAHTFTGLEEGKTHKVAVQARNPQGWSPSGACDMRTLPAVSSSPITGTGKYHFTEGTVKGVLYAAQTAINDYASNNPNTWNSCKTTINKTKLAAIMLSIPPGEAYNARSPSAAPSPMTLSRWDHLGHYVRTHVYTVEEVEKEEIRSLNIRLYSHMEKEGYLRSHWSPGVGLWQIDLFYPAINLNHAERADTTKGGVQVAKFLLRSHCRNTTNDTGLRGVLNGRWHACSPIEDGEEVKDVCYNRYKVDNDKIYDDGKLNIAVVKQVRGITVNQVDGGIHERLCRWTSDLIPMPCYLYDTGRPQGGILNDDMDGSRSGMTPYPSAFISFTDPKTGIKYAVWPSRWLSSAHLLKWPTERVSSVKAIYRAVMPNEYVRCSPGRDLSPESSESSKAADDCAEEIYKPFGVEIRNTEFDNGQHIVEGWFDHSVPFAKGQNHTLEVQNCKIPLGYSNNYIVCWWSGI